MESYRNDSSEVRTVSFQRAIENSHVVRIQLRLCSEGHSHSVLCSAQCASVHCACTVDRGRIP